MMDPIFSAGTAKLGEVAKGGKVKDIGVGQMDEEKRCVRYITYVSFDSVDDGFVPLKKSIVMDNRAVTGECGGDESTSREELMPTLGDVRDRFFNSEILDDSVLQEVQQQQPTRIVDQDGYEVDPDSPVYYYSKHCRLSVRICDSRTRGPARAMQKVRRTAQNIQEARKQRREARKCAGDDEEPSEESDSGWEAGSDVTEERESTSNQGRPGILGFLKGLWPRHHTTTAVP